jgi:hypothetical protein
MSTHAYIMDCLNIARYFGQHAWTLAYLPTIQELQLGTMTPCMRFSRRSLSSMWIVPFMIIINKNCCDCVHACRFDGTRLLMPTKTEIMKHKIIVTTLLEARVLFLMGIKKGHFSHILVDEAAQVIIHYISICMHVKSQCKIICMYDTYIILLVLSTCTCSIGYN